MLPLVTFPHGDLRERRKCKFCFSYYEKISESELKEKKARFIHAENIFISVVVVGSVEIGRHTIYPRLTNLPRFTRGDYPCLFNFENLSHLIKDRFTKVEIKLL